MSRFLRFVVEESLAGNADRIKEYTIGVDVFGKPAAYNPDTDSTVRTEASKLRARLAGYYENEGRDAPLIVSIPKGTYVPLFRERPKSESPRPRIKRAPAIAAIAAVLLLAAALPALLRRSPSEPEPAIRVLLHPPAGVRVADLRTTGPPLLSPDGRSVAFVGTAAGKPRVLWVQKLDAAEASALPNTEDASYPFWSPDSRKLGFFARGKLKTIDTALGVIHILCDAPSGRGGTWSSSGVLLFAPSFMSPLFRIAEGGGVPVAVTSQQGAQAHLAPSFLPDEQRFVYNVQVPGNQFELHLGSLADPSLNRRLAAVNSHAAYASGHLLFVRESALKAVPFDAGGKINGEARVIASGVASAPERAVGDFSVSANGVLLYRQTRHVSPQLAWYDRRGLVSSSTPAGSDRDVSLSLSGRFLSTVEFDQSSGTLDLWLYDFERKTRARTSSGEGAEYTPVWSHDDRTLYFTAHEVPHYRLYRQDALTSGAAARLAERSDWFAVTDVSQDGNLVLLQSRTVPRGHDLLRIHAASGAVEPLLQTRFNEAQARFSRDGRWLAYVSDETGRYEVYVSPVDNIGVRFPVSQAGGVQPRWRRDGKELFFVSLDGDLMAVNTPFQNRSPVKLFATAIDAKSKDAVEFTQYAVSAGGDRFLMRTAKEKETAAPWMLMVNWPASMAGRVN